MFCFCKQKTAYEMRISDWSSDVCSSDLGRYPGQGDCGRAGIHTEVDGGGREQAGRQRCHCRQLCWPCCARRAYSVPEFGRCHCHQSAAVSKLVYNPKKDLQPVTMLVSTPEVLVVPSSGNIKSLAEDR